MQHIIGGGEDDVDEDDDDDDDLNDGLKISQRASLGGKLN